MKNISKTKLIGGALVLTGAMLATTAPALAQGYGAPPNYAYSQAGQFDNLVSRIALYPDPLLAQIFSAAVYPDQIAAAAQGAPGPFDPSVEALLQYPSVLQMMASDPGWTQALGQAVMQNQAAVMDEIQNLRQEAQQYGYLQSGPQMQVMNEGGYIDIEPVGGYMYVPMYDPYVVFARPRAGFFVGGAIRFGGGFRWASGYNSFNWRNHEVFVNRREWTPSAGRMYEPQRQFAQRPFEQRSFENNGRSIPDGNRGWNRGYTAPAAQPPVRRNFAPSQPSGNYGRQFEQRAAPAPQQQRNFAPAQRGGMEQRSFAPPQQMQQRNFAPQMQQRNAAPQQMQQRGFAPQNRNQGGNFQRGNEGRNGRR